MCHLEQSGWIDGQTGFFNAVTAGLFSDGIGASCRLL